MSIAGAFEVPARDAARNDGRKKMTNTTETISEIIRLNPSASAAFLSQFGADELVEYLQRLSDLRAPRRSGMDESAGRKPTAQNIAGAA